MVKLNKTVLIAIIVVVIVISGILAYYFLMFGTLYVYIKDQSELVKICLTVNSIMIHRVNGSWITITNNTITILLSPNMTLLASSRIPVGDYNEIFLMVTKVLVVLPILNVT